ncbi:4'-phosphopantetheinyl transferase family protein [Pseudophaeobacter leonis]|uniref:4'-phosphopantetheinyl transferase family protein n=1 Tax=Pseudophaeobacter leonis TaxID=1144477 RepID=UPI0009F73918|nr:4'-phosphopantetheinyl transferase superfamily protein [Pseudophaeobacter leonis]
MASSLETERYSLVRPLFANDIALALSNPLGQPAVPFAEEAACLSPNAVAKRRQEFAAGRDAAHQAMALLGAPVQAIPVAENRAPIWPAGLVGSISHTRSCAMAVVAHAGNMAAGDIRGLGLDVEEDKPLADELWPAICSVSEQDWLRQQAKPGQMAKLVFSAKEAAYKCQFTLSARYYGFDGMELNIDVENQRFTARYCADQPPFSCGDCISGRFAIGAGLMVTTDELRV